MHAERTRSAGPPATSGLSILIRTRHAAAVCVVCGHEQLHGARRGSATCPDCGAAVILPLPPSTRR